MQPTPELIASAVALMGAGATFLKAATDKVKNDKAVGVVKKDNAEQLRFMQERIAVQAERIDNLKQRLNNGDSRFEKLEKKIDDVRAEVQLTTVELKGATAELKGLNEKLAIVLSSVRSPQHQREGL